MEANKFADYTADELHNLRGHKPPPPAALNVTEFAAAAAAAAAANGTNGTASRRLLTYADGSPTPACNYPFSCYPANLDWTTVQVGRRAG